MGGYSSGQPRQTGGIRWIALVLFAVYGIYYYFSHQQTVPGTGRKQLVDLSREQEAALGYQSYRQILAQSDVVPGGQLVDTIRDIGQKLARVTGAQGFNWEFQLIRSNQVNAFCLPGGKVAVYTGLIPVVRNSNALAIVMGHEIAHAIARHGAERMAHQKLLQLGTLAAGVAVGDMDDRTRMTVMGALGVGAQYGIMLPFSREHESEADHLGLLYAAKACFDPEEAPRLWQRMAQASGSKPAEFMSTHPSDATRIRQLEAWMPDALAAKQQSCGR